MDFLFISVYPICYSSLGLFVWLASFFIDLICTGQNLIEEVIFLFLFFVYGWLSTINNEELHYTR